jgi:tetratricopeptide (TPR) repeat protein
VAVGVSELLRRFPSIPKAGVVAPAVAIILSLGVVSNLRHPAWKNNTTLWGTTIEDFPTAWGAFHGYGVALQQEGDLRGAQEAMEKALALGAHGDHRARIECDLGVVLGHQNRFEESIAVLQRSYARLPYAKTAFNLGLSLMNVGRLDQAKEAFHNASRANPFYARPFAMLAMISLRQNNPAEGQLPLARARALSPNDPVVAQVSGEYQRLEATGRAR